MSRGDIFSPPTPWREALMPASYGGARFHCEVNSRESGTRTVVHQFPKKDLPYAESMGREARTFSVRGYCIVFGHDTTIPLYKRDYREARDVLMGVLEAGEPAVLQLPTQPSQIVVCPRYRLTEEEKLGGYCVFDMTFVEYGAPPSEYAPGVATAAVVSSSAKLVRAMVLRTLAPTA